MPDPTAHRSGDAWYNRHLVARSALPGLTVHIEGKTDARLFKKLLAVPLTGYQIGGGYQEVEKAVRLANKNCQHNLLALTDADERRLEGKQPLTNMIWTDGRDAEMMMLHKSSGALRSLVCEWEISVPNEWHGSSPDVAVRTEALRNKLFELALPAARLRHAMSGKPWQVSLDKIPYQRWIDDGTWQLNLGSLVDHIVKQRRSGCPNKNELFEIACTAPTSEDAYDLCRGHDVTTILALYAYRKRGNGSRDPIRHLRGEAIKVMRDEVEGALRTAYSREDFHWTRMHCKIWKWQNSTGRTVLKVCGKDCWDAHQPCWCGYPTCKP